MSFDPPALSATPAGHGIPLFKGDLRGFNRITPLFKGGYGGIKVRLQIRESSNAVISNVLVLQVAMACDQCASTQIVMQSRPNG
jgi:hypothetical protein